MSSVRHGRRRSLSALILLHLGVRHRIRRIECELFMTANRLWPIRFEHRIPLAGKIRFDSVLFRERDGQGKGRIRARKSGDSANAIIELLPPDRRERLASLIFPPSRKLRRTAVALADAGPATGTASSNGVRRERATASQAILEQFA
jgi:hypothetical protein